MKEQEENRSKSLEGVATLEGIRSDTITHQMDPLKTEDENPRYPENQDIKKMDDEAENKNNTADKTNNSEKPENEGKPFTENIYGDEVG